MNASLAAAAPCMMTTCQSWTWPLHDTAWTQNATYAGDYQPIQQKTDAKIQPAQVAWAGMLFKKHAVLQEVQAHTKTKAINLKHIPEWCDAPPNMDKQEWFPQQMVKWSLLHQQRFFKLHVHSPKEVCITTKKKQQQSHFHSESEWAKENATIMVLFILKHWSFFLSNNDMVVSAELKQSWQPNTHPFSAATGFWWVFVSARSEAQLQKWQLCIFFPGDRSHKHCRKSTIFLSACLCCTNAAALLAPESLVVHVPTAGSSLLGTFCLAVERVSHDFSRNRKCLFWQGFKHTMMWDTKLCLHKKHSVPLGQTSAVKAPFGCAPLGNARLTSTPRAANTNDQNIQTLRPQWIASWLHQKLI